MWKLYILETDTDNYYVGITKNLEMRLDQHQSGIGANYTQRFNQIKLVYSETFPTRKQAEIRERQVKGWSKSKKQALINQDFSLLSKLSKNSEFVEGTIKEG